MKLTFAKTVIIFILLSIVSCTYYNSDKVNMKMIQGKWQLVDVEHNIYDTVSVDYTKEQTYLIFEDDKCTQYMPDLKDTLKLNFSIRDYQLAFIKDSTLISVFSIDSLTEQTLILSHETNERIYKKVEQN